jgi:hypothetical protein
MDLDLMAPAAEQPNVGVMSTEPEARKAADLIGVVGGGAVSIVVLPLMFDQTALEAKNYHLVLANGRTVNCKVLLTKLANNADPSAVLGEYQYGNGDGPAGVSFECTETEFRQVLHDLAQTGILALAPQGGGPISEGATDVDAAGRTNFPPPPPGNGKANYVVVLSNVSTNASNPNTGIGGRAVVVNAAFIGRMLAKYGPQGAIAFANTRKNIL